MIAIVELTDENSDFEKQVVNSNDKIVYRLNNLRNYYIIETSKKERYQCLEYVKSIHEEMTASLQELSFIPHITVHDLRQNSYMGWGGVTVAVVDTGINGMPATLNLNFLDGSDNVQDYVNHGTIVANIIKYFAPACNIAALKVTDSNRIFQSKVIMSLDYIASNPDKFNIVNLSFAFDEKCDSSTCLTCKLISLIERLGIMVIVAAGNTGPDSDTITCPGCSKSALTIGALSQDGSGIAVFSSRGDGINGKPDLIAPSCVHIQLPQKKAPEDVSGTSFSAPIVTGICASFFSNANKDSKIVKNIIMHSLSKLNGFSGCEQGAGVIDINKLLEVLKDELNHSNFKQSSH